jgi:hypothetical protein
VGEPWNKRDKDIVLSNDDILTVLGFFAAVVGFIFWAWPTYDEWGQQSWFGVSRWPASLNLYALSMILLLLRRR